MSVPCKRGFEVVLYLGLECLLPEAGVWGEGQDPFSQAAAAVSWPQWILLLMCFPKWLLVPLMQLVNFKMMSAFAMLWNAL